MENKKKLDPSDIAAFAADNIDASVVVKMMELMGSYEASPDLIGRWQDQVILDEIPKGSSVLDLGCGDGDLLSKLILTLGVKGQGVELDPMAVLRSIDRGVPVLNIDLDKGLGDFADQSFDYVILEGTLQTLKEPMAVLTEMLRVGRRGIMSFPNFGHWRVRFDLSLRGRMPMTRGLPYGWHDTPNIHLFTLADFMDWSRQNQVNITMGFGLENGRVRPLKPGDNLTVEEALLFLEKGEHAPD
ncbi:methionine biosynthesis protein MetW [Deltaproteobacteria bacterium OttesenSCG-928-K17]|nr:methionine biosynthesis protein MetW [Deltaproteobacteria bacterium OttesenSCG-928-K17]